MVPYQGYTGIFSLIVCVKSITFIVSPLMALNRSYLNYTRKKDIPQGTPSIALIMQLPLLITLFYTKVPQAESPNIMHATNNNGNKFFMLNSSLSVYFAFFGSVFIVCFHLYNIINLAK